MPVKMEEKKDKADEKLDEREKGVIKVGASRPTAVYTPYVMSELFKNKKVILKARGRAITKAVDLAEITKNKLVEGSRIESIKTGTVQMPMRDSDRNMNVSTIEILLVK